MQSSMPSIPPHPLLPITRRYLSATYQSCPQISSTFSTTLVPYDADSDKVCSVAPVRAKHLSSAPLASISNSPFPLPATLLSPLPHMSPTTVPLLHRICWISVFCTSSVTRALFYPTRHPCSVHPPSRQSILQVSAISDILSPYGPATTSSAEPRPFIPIPQVSAFSDAAWLSNDNRRFAVLNIHPSITSATIASVSPSRLCTVSTFDTPRLYPPLYPFLVYPILSVKPFSSLLAPTAWSFFYNLSATPATFTPLQLRQRSSPERVSLGFLFAWINYLCLLMLLAFSTRSRHTRFVTCGNLFAFTARLPLSLACALSSPSILSATPFRFIPLRFRVHCPFRRARSALPSSALRSCSLVAAFPGSPIYVSILLRRRPISPFRSEDLSRHSLHQPHSHSFTTFGDARSLSLFLSLLGSLQNLLSQPSKYPRLPPPSSALLVAMLSPAMRLGLFSGVSYREGCASFLDRLPLFSATFQHSLFCILMSQLPISETLSFIQPRLSRLLLFLVMCAILITQDLSCFSSLVSSMHACFDIITVFRCDRNTKYTIYISDLVFSSFSDSCATGTPR